MSLPEPNTDGHPVYGFYQSFHAALLFSQQIFILIKIENKVIFAYLFLKN